MLRVTVAVALAAIFAFGNAFVARSSSAPPIQVLEGPAAYGDWRSDAPGIRRHISPSDLPSPYSSRPASDRVTMVKRPADAQLSVRTGFKVELFAAGLSQPRLIRVAPNGDIFVAESFAGRIRVLRPSNNGEKIRSNSVFASNLKRPFGIAFYPNGENPKWVYIANTDSVVRFPYRNGDLSAKAAPEIVVPALPSGGTHWTRDIVFSLDDTRMFVSVGSASNNAASRQEAERADVLVFDPEGNGRRIFASGIRNCVGMAVNPSTGDIWCSVNERDGLGDNLPPDYITRVRDGGFYGWPWYYIGANEDPLHRGSRPDLKGKVIVPDILIQPHSASLQMMFYTGSQFPHEYDGNIFAAEHGSWNRSKRTGYKIIRGIVTNGRPTGEYEDFVTGFVIDDGHAWGRPVGVAQAKDGSLLFSDDGNGALWRVTHVSDP
jgi:glucose/arabinose dehydrogenase